MGVDEGSASAAAWYSRRVIDGERPGYVERTDDRINTSDTGWRFYAGDEPQAYLDALENCVVSHLAHAIERWPELGTLIRQAPESGEWVWDDRARAYRPLD